MIMNMLSVSIVELQKRNEQIDLSKEKNSRMSGNFFVYKSYFVYLLLLNHLHNVGRNVLRPTNFLLG